MNSSIVYVLIFSLISFTSAQGAGTKCNADNIKPQKCVPGKGFCISRVRGISYKDSDITPNSFIVSWNSVAAATCYYIEVLTGSTEIAYKTISCFKGTTYKVGGLRPWQVYGFRVSAVNRRCKRGQPSTPVLRIKTFWDETFKATQPPKIVLSPKPGKCGKGRFTCHSGKRKCIPMKRWCNRNWNCEDGSDERYCPGGCNEIDVDFKNGNYSCSFFGSPGSFCFFDCDDGYVRDGARYTRCVRNVKRWSHAIPTCRLEATQMFKIIPEDSTETAVAIEWESVDYAAQYVFQVAKKLHTNDEADEFTVSETVNATACCNTVINGLTPKVEYQISMWAIDDEGLLGMESMPVFFTAEKSPKA